MIYIDFNSAEDQTIGQFTLEDATGAAVNADSTPTVEFWDRLRIDDWALLDLMPVVVSVSTGHYHIYMPGSSLLLSSVWTYAPFWPVVTAVIGGITKKIPLAPFDAKPPAVYGRVVTDGSNTATAFEVASLRGPLLASDDDAVFALAIFVSGACAGEVAEVDSYNFTTGFLTLKRALTTTPSNNDVFRLINS